MSAQPGRIEACKGCDYQDIVCPDDCEIYQDLRDEYELEVYMEREDER